jgi:acyl-CoA thioesterase
LGAEQPPAVTHSKADKHALAERAAKALYDPDRASQALGIRLVAIAPQACTVAMTVRPDMTNGHSICHGGLIFMLADSAFAFACNSGGEPTVAATASIDFLAEAREGDELTASAQELWRGGRSGIYEVVVTNQTGARIALFRGRSHRIGVRQPEKQHQS